MPIEKQNWTKEFFDEYNKNFEQYEMAMLFDSTLSGVIADWCYRKILEREKELYAKVKEYFKLTSNRGDNFGEYLARNVILQEDILEIIDQSLLDIDEK